MPTKIFIFRYVISHKIVLEIRIRSPIGYLIAYVHPLLYIQPNMFSVIVHLMSKFQNMVFTAHSYIYKSDKYSKHIMYKLHKYKNRRILFKKKQQKTKIEYVRKILPNY